MDVSDRIKQAADHVFEVMSTRVSPEDLRSRSRKRCIVLPRQMAMYLTRKFTRHSLAEIGALFDRDHSTVLHSIRKVEESLQNDPKLVDTVHDITANITNK